jgi:hypothetical protein
MGGWVDLRADLHAESNVLLLSLAASICHCDVTDWRRPTDTEYLGCVNFVQGEDKLDKLKKKIKPAILQIKDTEETVRGPHIN